MKRLDATYVPSPWQVKWYLILLAVGNWVEVLFRFGLQLGWHVTETWRGSEASCKLLLALDLLGPSLTGMALAALSLHVLLTAITGCQGERLRHALVIGLFVLLSLPLPLSRVSLLSPPVIV